MKQLKEGEDFILRSDGLMVLTEKYHRKEDIAAATGADIALIYMTASRTPPVALRPNEKIRTTPKNNSFP